MNTWPATALNTAPETSRRESVVESALSNSVDDGPVSAKNESGPDPVKTRTDSKKRHLRTPSPGTASKY